MAKNKKNNLNPWITKKQKVVYKNPWIKVREDKVIRPDGKDGIYGVIEKAEGIGIVALDDKENILMVGEWRYAIKKYSWSIIGGTREKGETPLKSAKRELLEETNNKARKWKHLFSYYPTPEVFTELAHIYLAQDLYFAKAQDKGFEKLKVKQIPFKKALNMIKNGKILDGFAITGLLRTKEILKL